MLLSDGPLRLLARSRIYRLPPSIGANGELQRPQAPHPAPRPPSGLSCAETRMTEPLGLHNEWAHSRRHPTRRARCREPEPGPDPPTSESHNNPHGGRVGHPDAVNTQRMQKKSFARKGNFGYLIYSPDTQASRYPEDSSPSSRFRNLSYFYPMLAGHNIPACHVHTYPGRVGSCSVGCRLVGSMKQGPRPEPTP